MSLSKITKYAAIGVGLVVFGEIYFECTMFIRKFLQLRDESKELNEVICTNSVLNYDSEFLRQIKFADERALHVAEILKNLILSARKTIHIAMYIFTSRILADALITARENGVDIYLIIDHSMEAASNTQVHLLNKKGINVKVCHDNTLHHKFCLIDVPSKNKIFLPIKKTIANDKPRQVFIPNNGILINGSLNWTQEGMTNNYENIIVTSNKAIIAGYIDEFIKRWKSEKSRELNICQ
ncbi:hypothetical protein PVAND_005278 [Polypedilum vanderplanki]|uniref:Mitochondrial cardiolipin hydrolase n=1 Tax=Polypedilum vanderplanki TaxID=319348 RepID=A0A9J6BZG5_POLVA|nr:hypothetical protein PVAND_005278 [Polypedilum vanderplanki]